MNRLKSSNSVNNISNTSSKIIRYKVITVVYLTRIILTLALDSNEEFLNYDIEEFRKSLNKLSVFLRLKNEFNLYFDEVIIKVVKIINLNVVSREKFKILILPILLEISLDNNDIVNRLNAELTIQENINYESLSKGTSPVIINTKELSLLSNIKSIGSNKTKQVEFTKRSLSNINSNMETLNYSNYNQFIMQNKTKKVIANNNDALNRKSLIESEFMSKTKSQQKAFIDNFKHNQSNITINSLSEPISQAKSTESIISTNIVKKQKSEKSYGGINNILTKANTKTPMFNRIKAKSSKKHNQKQANLDKMFKNKQSKSKSQSLEKNNNEERIKPDKHRVSEENHKEEIEEEDEILAMSTPTNYDYYTSNTANQPSKLRKSFLNLVNQ